MARITSSNRMRVIVDVPTTPQPLAAQPTAPTTTPSLPNMNESFADSKQKLLSLGRTNKTPALMRGTPPAGSFQIKNAAVAAAATRAIADPKLAASFAEKTAGKTAKQVFAAFSQLSPSQRNAITAEVTANPTRYQGSVALAVVHNMSPDQLKNAVEQMRGANGTQTTSLESSIACELAANTRWGKSHPEVVARMREGIASGKTIFDAPANGAAADTDKFGIIKLGPHLAKSPEQLAATLAHESTHAENADEKKGLNKMSEETSGVDTEIAVFKELSAKNPAAFNGLSKDDAARYREYMKLTPAGSHARTAGMYAQKAEELHAHGEDDDYKKQVKQIVGQLAKEPDAVKELDQRGIRQLIDAVNQTGGSMKELGAVLKNASPDMKLEALKYLSGPDNKDALAQLVSGMN